MQVTVETTQGLERRMRVEIPEERVRDEIDKRLVDLARTVNIPGFRPGRVPARVVARRFERQVRDEVVGGIVQESLINALEQEQLRPAVPPRIEPLEADAGAGVRYTATFDVFPDITLPRFESIPIARPVAEVADADIDKVLERMRVQRRTWRSVERPATASDRVVIDLEALVDGERLDEAGATELAVELDARSMIDGFEDGLVGATPGESRTLDLVFPNRYPAHLAARPVTFNVSVHRVEEPELPDLDDAFAKGLGVAEGGVEALRGEVRANLERELVGGLHQVLEQRVMDALLAATDVDLPESMVREGMEQAMRQRHDELHRAGIDPHRNEPEPTVFEEPVRRRISLDLLVAAIVKEHGIELDHARVRARVEAIASTYQEPAKVLDWYYSDRGRLSTIESTVFGEQVVEWVVERAQVVEEPTSFDQVMNAGQTDPVVA